MREVREDIHHRNGEAVLMAAERDLQYSSGSERRPTPWEWQGSGDGRQRDLLYSSERRETNNERNDATVRQPGQNRDHTNFFSASIASQSTLAIQTNQSNQTIASIALAGMQAVSRPW